MSSENYPGLEAAVEAFIAREGSITPLRIREVIRAFRAMPMCDVPDEEAEFLARSIEVRYDVTMKLGPVLTERGYRPWLESVKADVDFYYWGRYRKLLQEKHFSPQVLSTIHEDTDRTLGLLENPLKEGAWNRRGLVMGHVQSGKTANYIGLICKAADAGYRLIVVIAGVHNNLRNQTQKRIDEGFVGRDSARMLSQREERHIGVGRFDPARRPVTFTNSVRDFNKTTATGVGIPLHNLNEPVVFVIKKNTSTLKNLLEWLREHNASHGNSNVMAPMLLIDDEADNASINVRHGKGEVSRINGQIRELLQMFVRSCYVGYTATPFANIFIDPDTDDEMRGADLFPRHFIVSIDPPSSYFGAERVFREDSESVRHIEDNEDLLPLRHTIEHVVRALPPSLITAIHTFVVARAIRLHRGHEGRHCSMLVNASRFTGVQGQIRNEIQRRLEDLQASVRLNCALPSEHALRDPEISELNGVWRREYANAGASWDEVQQHLHDAAAPIKVVEVNCRAHGTLNYDQYESTGLSVIAVGGFALSRGLTLEGLMVSYFLRNSMMYDTLMQMGRWFGYRPGYDDLCRVWMPEEAAGWYAHIAESIEELRDELRTMAAASATPEEFGLKVRAHPDTLIVTARNKMGSGEPVIVHIGLATESIETATLRNDKRSLAGNRNVARLFAASLAGYGTPVTQARWLVGSGWLLNSVPVGPIRAFIGAFVNHPLSLMTDTGPVLRYIEDREESELAVWDVLFAGIGSADGTIVDISLGITINCQIRTAGRKSDALTIRVTNKQRVASRGVEKTGLEESDIQAAEREYREDQGDRLNGKAQRNYPDKIYRKKRKRPLLIIHMLTMLKQEPNPDRELMHAEPVVAWGISFPPTQHPEKRVTYIVNATWLQENFRDDVDEEEMEGDDV